MDIEPIDNLLNSRLNKLGLSKELQAAYVLSKANTLANGRFQAIRFSHGVLTLRCASSIAAQEIKFIEQDLIKELNKITKPFEIKKLSYRARG